MNVIDIVMSIVGIIFGGFIIVLLGLAYIPKLYDHIKWRGYAKALHKAKKIFTRKNGWTYNGRLTFYNDNGLVVSFMPVSYDNSFEEYAALHNDDFRIVKIEPQITSYGKPCIRMHYRRDRQKKHKKNQFICELKYIANNPDKISHDFEILKYNNAVNSIFDTLD